ncbi:MAG: hypothetical protein A2Z18_10830 [Armatimonadetes bacterium RBG_16_58_9]|nr:MAG: hypothetical protein A2Z18_10830 [Armatimonadetes bacterium RBG_16_58_9]
MANRYKVIQGGPYPHLITCSIVRWLPIFISGPYFTTVIDSLEHARQNRGLLVHAYVIMPTHIHAIVTAIGDDLSAIVRDFKKFTSRAIYNTSEAEGNQLLTWLFRKAAEGQSRSQFKVWQDEFHPKVIGFAEMFQQKAEYIHLNPVRKGLVAEAEKYYYSSASAYAGAQPGPLTIDFPDW